MQHENQPSLSRLVLTVTLPLVNAAAEFAAAKTAITKTHAVGYFKGIALTDARSRCERTKRLAICDSGVSGCWNGNRESTVSIIWSVPTRASVAFKLRRYDRAFFIQPAEATKTNTAPAGLIGSWSC